MRIYNKLINLATDRFSSLRLGQVLKDLDENGMYSVRWLDTEAGGQSNVFITYPYFNNSTNPPWGIECGIEKGTIGIFGFLSDNHAVLLSTIISWINNYNVGFDKTGKIKSGEIRITSKNGAKVYMDLDGNLKLSTKRLSINLNEDDGQIEINGPKVLVNGREI
jgi:hypothetical protein